ncbi:MAG: SRPBCC domain-containing protein [Terriglobales bacterium]
MGRGNPYSLEGEFTEADSPRKLVHTWIAAGNSVGQTKVTYHLEPIDAGTRITLCHSGFSSPLAYMMTAAGWETYRLSEILVTEKE